MSVPQQDLVEQQALKRAAQALQLAVASVPHLAGLARLARLKATERIPAAAVAASGLTLINPALFAKLPLGDAAYIMAHELMHLALDTHGRQGRADRLVANFAHDYVINDILTHELGRQPPIGGLFMQGARESSFEQLVTELSQGAGTTGQRCWAPDGMPGAAPPPPSPMSRALADAGLVEQQPDKEERQFDDALIRGDLVPEDLESEFEPEMGAARRRTEVNRVKQAATKSASLAELSKQVADADDPAPANVPDCEVEMMDAIRRAYHTPWQLALQRWMDAVAPAERTYARPSRRAGSRTDVVLPGRHRCGWTLHIVLDTSGSMETAIPEALGAIAQFCEASNVFDVHVVQCDTQITRDDWVDPAGLARFEIAGFGYSDMRPAMRKLDQDPEVTAIVMLTDGYIDTLEKPPHYDVLWILMGERYEGFAPDYGQVIWLDP